MWVLRGPGRHLSKQRENPGFFIYLSQCGLGKEIPNISSVKTQTGYTCFIVKTRQFKVSTKMKVKKYCQIAIVRCVSREDIPPEPVSPPNLGFSPALLTGHTQPHWLYYSVRLWPSLSSFLPVWMGWTRQELWGPRQLPLWSDRAIQWLFVLPFKGGVPRPSNHADGTEGKRRLQKYTEKYTLTPSTPKCHPNTFSFLLLHYS